MLKISGVVVIKLKGRRTKFEIESLIVEYIEYWLEYIIYTVHVYYILYIL